VRVYNTFVVETEGRRVQVVNSVDLRQVAFAMLRALKQRTETVCFVTGHGEAFDERPAHVHYSHIETGHEEPGAEDVVVGPAEGLDRLRLALDAFGYAARAVVPAMLEVIPEDCAVVADIGPRRSYAPAEPGVLKRYLARGGRLLLMYDPAFPVGPELEKMLASLGLAVDDAIVIDPVNHYETEQDKIAIPYYPPHPITDRLAMTVLPDARPLRILGAREGIAAMPLFSSSESSWLRLTDGAPQPQGGAKPGAAILAVAVQGRVETAQNPFRLVLAGNSSFATNAFFPLVSNGELAVSIVRWLSGDMDTPNISPERYSLPEVTLSHRQMQGVFAVVEILLPLSVALTGVVVWWRRR
jgi:ABC-2 type transport system permease protein